MPELPEVETIVRRLRPELIGRRIQAVRVPFPGILRLPERAFVRSLTGKVVTDVQRRGKMILINLGRDMTLVIHLKMTGQVLLVNESAPSDRHTHAIFTLNSGGRELRYRDVRKFGFLDLVRGDQPADTRPFSRLGPDPFEIRPGRFAEILESKKGAIKPLLLNQSLISGLGNIYVDESLFQARLHPLTRIEALSTAQLKNLHRIIRKILSRAVEKQGSTLKDYRRPDGSSGGYQNYHQVYGRFGLPCPSCGALIQKMRVGGRGSHFCPVCQKRC